MLLQIHLSEHVVVYRFFTAVAIYQLHEKGLLNVSDAVGILHDNCANIAPDCTTMALTHFGAPCMMCLAVQVNGYIDPADFGLDGPWCPIIHGQEQLGCQEPTIRELLQMSSGLLPTDDQSCGTPNTSWTPSNWFWPYRQGCS